MDRLEKEIRGIEGVHHVDLESHGITRARLSAAIVEETKKEGEEEEEEKEEEEEETEKDERTGTAMNSWVTLDKEAGRRSPRQSS